MIARAVAVLVASLGAGMAAAEPWQERGDWAGYFADAGVEGTIVVVDERVHGHWIHGPARAIMGFHPASTFKIPHALFALDAGVVRDEFQLIPWDGVQRDMPPWNRDQDLRSSMRYSVVWVYQGFARTIGAQREQRYLSSIDYGNAEVSGRIDRFWLDGGLRISATEQVRFLQRLYRNELPFKVEHQRLVKDLMIVEAGREWILRGKSGWQGSVEPQVGWWVGWVEWQQGPVFFAINIAMPNEADDLPKREGIARSILASIGALPADRADGL
jgi:beta-lactamase class D